MRKFFRHDPEQLKHDLLFVRSKSIYFVPGYGTQFFFLVPMIKSSNKAVSTGMERRRERLPSVDDNQS